MYVSTLVWTLRPGKTHDDFVQAWYPDGAAEMPTTAYTGVSIAKKNQVIVLGIHDTDLSRDELAQVLLRASARDVQRNQRIAEVVESMQPGNIWEIRSTFDLTTDAGLDAGRP